MSVQEESVRAFVQARGRQPQWPGIQEPLRPRTIEDGYRLQAAVHARLAAAGDLQVGWKVGSTSASGQLAFGLREPVYAGLFASGRSASLYSPKTCGAPPKATFRTTTRPKAR